MNEWNENHTICAITVYVPQTSSPECAVIGSWRRRDRRAIQGKDCCWLQGGGTREQEGGEYGGESWRRRQSWMQGTTAKSCTEVEPSL